MRKKCMFEKITDMMLVGSIAIVAFCAGAKFQEKRGAR
jgi:hypothetical protein